MKRLPDSLPVKNIRNRPARSAALLLLTAILTFSLLAGTLAVLSLNRGLHSLRDRMGADIMVVPYQATTKQNIDLEHIIMFGNMGYFYMDSAIVDKIAEREGIGQISTQYYLSTLSASCCSVPVQVIGYDPETDFTITPWIRNSYGKELQDKEVVVGHKLNAFVGDTLTFYGVDVRVAAKLDETGTALDTAVYTTAVTIRQLIKASVALKQNTQNVKDPDKVVSCVLINAAEGVPVDEVLNDINIHIRKVRAFRTTSLMEGISASLDGVAGLVTGLAFFIWIFSLAVLVIAFTMSVNERKKEFAVMRALGASAGRVSQMVTQEGILLSLSGSLCGAVLALVLLVPFSGLIEQAIGLPFLLPGAAQVAAFTAAAVCMGVLCGAVTGKIAAHRLNRTDPGVILREV